MAMVVGRGPAGAAAAMLAKVAAPNGPPLSVTPNGKGPEGTQAALAASNPAETHEAVPPNDLPRSTAHVIHNLGNSITHADRHISAAQSAPDVDSLQYNLSHAAGHVADAKQQHVQLADHLGQVEPKITDELSTLHDMDNDQDNGPGSDDDNQN